MNAAVFTDDSSTNFEGVNLSQWQERGKDVHSVFVDPGIVITKEGYPKLKPDSPAFDIGFKAIDLRDAGIVEK